MADLELAITPAADLPAWFEAAAPDAVASINQALNSRLHKERWKYTRAQPVLELLSEPAEPPQWGTLPPGITAQVCERGEIDAPLAFDVANAPEACSALCYAERVHVLEVNGEVAQPLNLNHTSHTTPLVIRLTANARLDLRETYTGDDEQHQTLWFDLGPGSAVSHTRNSFNKGSHWQFLHVNIDRDARYQLYNHSGGAQLRRQDVQIICAGPGAHAEIASAAFIAPQQHLDQQVTIEHRAANSSSNQVFHNIAGNKAKVTFNGRIHIHADCSGADAHLTNKNLGLGDNAVINTKPELEIYTDDVKCSHGATVGQIDESHLFYCASRGIDPLQARRLLSQAFLNVCTQGPLAEQARTAFLEMADD